jgi:hypothetical protein
MKLTCDEATTICDKSQYGEASFWDILKLNFHIFICKNCGRYAKQNSILTKCYKNKKAIKLPKQCCLHEADKVTMDKNLKAQL